MENITNLQEKICLMIYNEPKKVGKISDEIYGKRNTRISAYITELKDKGWIEEIKYSDMIRNKYGQFKNGTKKDERKRFYRSTPKFIIDNIDVNISFEPIEIKQLKDVFDSSPFRDYIENYNFSFIRNSIIYTAIFTRIYVNYLCTKMNVKHSDLRKLFKKKDSKKGFPKDELKKYLFSTFNNIFPFEISEIEKINNSKYEDLIWEFIGKFDTKLLDKLIKVNYDNAIMLSIFVSFMLITHDSIDYTLKLKKKKNGFR